MFLKGNNKHALLHEEAKKFISFIYLNSVLMIKHNF